MPDLRSHVLDLLASPAYATCAQAWETRSRVQVSRDQPPSTVLNELIRDFQLSGVSVDAVAELLADHDFLAFLEGKARLDGAESVRHQEYPDGEEPTRSDADVVVATGAYTATAIAGNAIWYVAGQESRARLEQLLRQQRIPGAKAFAHSLVALLP